MSEVRFRLQIDIFWLDLALHPVLSVHSLIIFTVFGGIPKVINAFNSALILTEYEFVYLYSTKSICKFSSNTFIELNNTDLLNSARLKKKKKKDDVIS